MAITLCGPAFQQVHLASGLVTLLTRSCNPAVQARRFRLFRFRSPLLSESLLIYFPPGTEMVHFPGLARTRLYIQRAVYRFYRYGFPHSEIPGSKPACGSPRLIAASHALHRFLAPRHPPFALSSLTTNLRRTSLGYTRESTYSIVKEPHGQRPYKVSSHSALVEMTGVEPATPCVQGRCSPS